MADDTLMKLEETIPPDYHIRPGYYLKAGWELFKENAVGFIGFTVVALFVKAILASSGFGAAAVFVIIPPLWAGFIIVAMKLHLGQSTQVNDFVSGFKYILPIVLYSVVSSVFIFVGFVVLIIPGLYLLTGYVFTTWLIVDRRLDFWPAMELSRTTVHKHWFEVFGFFLLLCLINFGGLLLLGLGVFVTIPWTLCALTIAYKDVFGIQSSSF